MTERVFTDGPVKFDTIEDAIKTFVEMRDELTIKRRAYEAEETAYKEEMDKIQMWLRDKADELGVDSFASRTYGTAFRSVKTKYQVADFDSFLTWMKETDNFQCVERRVAKLATAEVHNDTGAVPPGINYLVEVTFDVRRPTK